MDSGEHLPALLKKPFELKKALLWSVCGISAEFGFDGPPCLEALGMNGVPGNGKTTTLYAVGVFLRKKNPDDWKMGVVQFNQEMIHPHVHIDEINQIIKRAGRVNFRYPCEDNPLKSLCNKEICAGRDYGVERTFGTGGVKIGSIKVIKHSTPTMWVVEVNDKELHLYTEELMSQTLFAERLMEKMYMLMEPMKKDAWREMLSRKLAEIEMIDDENDITDNYKFRHLLEQFFTKNPARKANEITLGRAFLSMSGYQFQLKDFSAYLISHGFRAMSSRDLAPMLRKLGGKNNAPLWNGSKTLYVWSMPANLFERPLPVEPVIVKGGDDE